jgi:predicted ABC-type transport system involved in lysophospholipase L1 biosynthesis ATPase subunit
MSERVVARVRARSIGFVFQAFNLMPMLSAAENVETALAPLGVGGAERRRLILIAALIVIVAIVVGVLIYLRRSRRDRDGRGES